MPKPQKGESKDKYISRCIRMVRREGTPAKEAAGKCFGMWRHYAGEKDK